MARLVSDRAEKTDRFVVLPSSLEDPNKAPPGTYRIVLLSSCGSILAFFTALVITAFVLAAEILEGLTIGRGRRAIRDLLHFLPATVTVRRDTGVARVPLPDVQRLPDGVGAAGVHGGLAPVSSILRHRPQSVGL